MSITVLTLSLIFAVLLVCFIGLNSGFPGTPGVTLGILVTTDGALDLVVLAVLQVGVGVGVLAGSGDGGLLGVATEGALSTNAFGGF